MEEKTLTLDQILEICDLQNAIDFVDDTISKMNIDQTLEKIAKIKTSYETFIDLLTESDIDPKNEQITQLLQKTGSKFALVIMQLKKLDSNQTAQKKGEHFEI